MLLEASWTRVTATNRYTSTQPLTPKVVGLPRAFSSAVWQDGHSRKVVAYHTSRLLSSTWAMLVCYCLISGPVEDQQDLARGQGAGPGQGQTARAHNVPRSVLVWLIRC